jgi:hypothetical protein
MQHVRCISLAQVLFSALLILHLLPIWLFKYIPTQDGPSHIYNSFVLKEYQNPDHGIFEQYYTVDPKLSPNWLSHAVMAVLMFLVPPLIAEKLLLTGYVFLFALALLYFLGAVNDRGKLLGIVGMLFIYNYPLHMGFYNFSYSVPLYLLAIGYWWRYRNSLNVRRAAVLNLIIIVIYFSHLVSVILAIVSVLFLSIVTYRRDVAKRRLQTFLYLIPSYILPIHYVAGRIWHFLKDRGEAPLMESIATTGLGKWTFGRLEYLTTFQSIVSFSPTQLLVGKGLMLIVFLLAVYTLTKAIHKKAELRCIGNPFFLLFALLCFAYYVAPDKMLGGTSVKFRLAMYPFLVLLAWLGQSWKLPRSTFERIWQNSMQVAMVSLVSVNLWLTAYHYKRLNVDLSEFTSGIRVIEPNRTILPLSFDHIGAAHRIGIFRHACAYYALSRSGIDFDNYEAIREYFPVNFRPELCRPSVMAIEHDPQATDIASYSDVVDYVITWCLPMNSTIANRIEQHYEIAFENHRLRIFEQQTKH